MPMASAASCNSLDDLIAVGLINGAVVVESIFGWPGIGQLSINAVQNRDYPLVIVCILVISVGFVVINLLVDVLAALIEPRLRS